VSDAPTRTLALAAQTLGGAQALAERLDVEHATLECWMAGEDVPPYDVFLKALDIVAAGPGMDPAPRASARGAQSGAAEGWRAGLQQPRARQKNKAKG